MIKKLENNFNYNFALTLNVNAGSDGEFILKKINHQKLKIVLKI